MSAQETPCIEFDDVVAGSVALQLQLRVFAVLRSTDRHLAAAAGIADAEVERAAHRVREFFRPAGDVR